jgi:hypothetical protein
MRAPERIRFDVDRREAHALLDALSAALARAQREPWARDAEALRAYLQERMRERRFL